MTNCNERPEAAAATAPPAATLTEARAAYVGRRFPLFEESFNDFDAAGGFRFTFTWPPLVFGLFWFLYRRMYIEAIVVFLAGLALVHLAAAWGGESENSVMIMSFGFSLALALAGRWLYWRAVDRRLVKAMRLYPHEPDRALAWLKWKGGVDPWCPIFAFVVLMAVIISASRWA